MNQLKVVSLNGQLVTDSRDVAEMIDKSHAHLMRDIKGYKDVIDHNPNLDSAQFFIDSNYTDSNKRERPCYLLTKKGCDMVANKMTGQKGVLFTAEYVTRFEQMEQQLQQPFNLPTTYKEALLQLVEKVDENEKLITTIEEQKPKVIYAEAVSVSNDTVLVKDLATVLKQKGVDIGANRLFKWLRENGYLCKKKGEMWNTPTQRSLDLGIMVTKHGLRTDSNGEMKKTRTPKITGKGQIYFINKFLKQQAVV